MSSLFLGMTIYGNFPDRIDNHINILYCNIRSLRNKLTDLSTYVHASSIKFQIIILNETWLENNDKHLYNIPDYQSFHSVRRKAGGGVSIYVSVKLSESDELENYEEEDSSYLVVEIKALKTKIITAYRPPTSQTSQYFRNIDKLLEKFNSSIFISDTNIDIFKTNNVTQQLMNTFLNNGHVLINPLTTSMYTRKNHLSSVNTCIDQAFSDLDKTKFASFYVDDIPELRLDHRAIIFSLNIRPTIAKISKTSSFSMIDHKAILAKKLLSDLRTQSLETFLLDLKSVFNNNTKTIYIDKRNRKPFMTSQIRNLIKSRDSYFLLHHKFPENNEITIAYKKLRNEVTNKIRTSQKDQNEKKLISAKGNIKKTWSHLNSILHNRNKSELSNCLTLKNNNMTVTDPLEIANIFNHFFINVANEIKPSRQIPTSNNQVEEELLLPIPWRHSPIHVDEIIEVATTLKSSSALDLDNMNNNLMKTYIPQIAPQLETIFNDHLERGLFHDHFKVAIVRPLHKGGSRQERTNYRPISKLSIFSEVFEKLILKRLTKYFDDNKIIVPTQFGFTKNSNTEAATVHLVKQIYDEIEKNKITAVLFVDFQKAFDTIDHEILINKLKKLGLKTNILNILINFLSDRQQAVFVNEVKSTFQNVKAGVPQGSILGPLLFMIYINSLAKLKLNGKLQLFADDLALIYGVSQALDLKKEIEEDLITINNWLNEHKMAMNTKKTNYLIFNGKRKREVSEINFDIVLDGEMITKVTEVKYLGLYLDHDLNFKTHINEVAKRVRPMIFAIKRIRPHINLNSANMLYYAYIHSHLIYLAPIWGAALKSDINTLYILQKKSIKIVNCLAPRTPSITLFSEKILPFPILLEYLTIALIFKMRYNLIKNMTPLKLTGDVSTRTTRRGGDFYIPNVKTNFATTDLYHRGPLLFNALSDNIKQYRTYRVFSNRVKEFLFAQYIREHS